MSVDTRCAPCNADNRDEQEALGVRAMNGELSWRAAATELGLTHGAGLKNHMEKHYVLPTRQATGHDYDVLIADSVEDLKAQMAVAPPELKPLYAVAIQNLVGLADTKPSQAHLIAAIKAIQEVTGMKMEQQMLLQYARHMEFEPPKAKPELEVYYEEAEVVEP